MTDIKRIDPHIEHIKRNRLHPRHHDVMSTLSASTLSASAPASYMGPNGVIRKNPHAIGFIGPNGLKRIDRLNVQKNASKEHLQKKTAQKETVHTKPLHTIDKPTAYIVVVPDLAAGRLSSHDKDVLGLARQLIDHYNHETSRSEQNSSELKKSEKNNSKQSIAVMAIAFGEHKESGWQDAGVDRLLELNTDTFSGYCPEAQTTALQILDEQINIVHFLFPDSVDGGADLGRRLSATLHTRPITHGWKWSDNNMRCRAGAGTLDVNKPLSKVMLLDAEIADPIDETRHEASCPLEIQPESLQSKQVTTNNHIQDQGLLTVNPADISLAETPFILSGGNGIRDWQVFHDAAHILRATEGASRVAVDDGFMPRDRQVGASGIWVSARVYIAVGISGAVQHLQGIAQVDKVIAINTNASCDMVKRADLSIIADSTDILEALIKLQQDTSSLTQDPQQNEKKDNYAA